MPKQLNRDTLNAIPVRPAATTTMAVFDRLQDFPAEMQIVALTAAFKLMVERFAIPPGDVFTVADNIINAADGRRKEFAAIAAYLENEL